MSISNPMVIRRQQFWPQLQVPRTQNTEHINTQ